MKKEDIDALIEFYKGDCDPMLKTLAVLGMGAQFIPGLIARNAELEEKIADLENQLKEAMERY